MYDAVVSRITTRPIPGADNILLGSIAGYNVIVSKETQDGQLMAFFPGGGVLSEEFCKVHDLIRRTAEDGTKTGGYFEENRRVRAVKMRGCKSEGFCVPLDHFEYTGVDSKVFIDGYTFSELNGHKICTKYVTPATAKRAQQVRAFKRGETPMFRKQPDIDQFRIGRGLIPDGSVIYITEKVHGTSFRYGYVLEETVPTRWEKIRAALIRPLGIKTTYRGWKYLNGSKNVILEHSDERNSYYGSDEFRNRVVAGISLRKGETLYGEITGWTHDARNGDLTVSYDKRVGAIMEPQDVTKLKDKTAQERYGKTMFYSYGNSYGECSIFIYRITIANEDGQTVELSWPQVKQRSCELGLHHVPELNSFIYSEYFGGISELEKVVDLPVNGESGMEALPSTIDSSHMREGVVVRAESEYGTMFLKHKSYCFGIMEGYIKDLDDSVDLEEIS